MDCSEKNDLKLELVQTKLKGAVSFKINGITVHSVYNPVSEGKKWAESAMEKITEKPEAIIIFGLGFGYHLKELVPLLNESYGIKEGAPEKIKITVVEPSIESFNFIKENYEMSDFLEENNINVFVPEEKSADAQNIIEQLGLKGQETFFLELASYKNIFSKTYDLIYKSYNISQFFSPPSFKVLIVQPMYGGSSTIGNYIYRAFLNCGYTVKIIDFSRFYDGYRYIGEFTQNEDHVNSLRQLQVNLMSEALLSSVMNDTPDMVLFMAQAPASERVILKLKSMGIKTAYWFVEDFRTMTYWGAIARNVDYFFTIQKDAFFKELKDIGINNFHYLPMACLPDFHNIITEKNEQDEKKYACDASFAGAGYFNRKNVFSQLLDFNFKIWGNDWEAEMPLKLFIQDGGRRFSEEEAVKIYNYSRININLHSSMWHWEINPNGDFLNPRVYEILGCGGFQLIDRRSYLEGVFEDGKDLVVFDSVSDLRKKIKYYLDHEDERKAIAAHGRETVRKFHTYEQRVSEMMNIILLDSYETIKPKLILRRENISKLLEETKGDPELHELLLHFADKGVVSIGELVNYIKRGKGRLSKTEAMILMLWAAKSKLIKLG